ncbi:MAG: 6-pyruvoyl tetrahydrobiopterin synthase [Gemmataceae bacterium]
MFRVSRELSFCYGHRLLNYEGKCRFLHGHNARVLVTLEADQLDRRGMVVDFTHIKETLQRWLDQELDHKMILHRSDPVVPLLQAVGEPIVLLDVNPTAENIARYIYDQAHRMGLPVTEVILWETDTSFATYRPRG